MTKAEYSFIEKSSALVCNSFNVKTYHKRVVVITTLLSRFIMKHTFLIICEDEKRMVLFSPMVLWFMYYVLLTHFCLYFSIVIHADAFSPHEVGQSNSTVNGPIQM